MFSSRLIVALPFQAVRSAREAREAKAGKWATVEQRTQGKQTTVLRMRKVLAAQKDAEEAVEEAGRLNMLEHCKCGGCVGRMSVRLHSVVFSS